MVKVPLTARLEIVQEIDSSADGNLGDLILLVRNAPQARRPDFAYFGVLTKVSANNELSLENAVVLYPAIETGGRPVHMIQPFNYRDAAIGYNGPHSVVIRRLDLIGKGFVGQDNIVAALKEEGAGFEAYADWIASMKKPYIRKK